MDIQPDLPTETVHGKSLKELQDIIHANDELLELKRKYNYDKVLILQFMTFALCSILYAFEFVISIVIKNIASSGGILGFLGFYLFDIYNNKLVSEDIKKCSLAENCYIQSMVCDVDKNIATASKKLLIMKKSMTHDEFLAQIAANLEEITEKYPYALDIFYETISHYDQKSWFQKLSSSFKSIFVTQDSSKVFEDAFWAKIYVSAYMHGNYELMGKIQLQYHHKKLGTQSLDRLNKALENEILSYNTQNSQTNIDISPLEDLVFSPQILEVNKDMSSCLKMISVSRFFGYDLILSLADIKTSITKGIVGSQKFKVSMSAAVTGTILGLSSTILTPLTIGLAALGAGVYSIRTMTRQFMFKKIEQNSLENLVFSYQLSQDDRWISLIHLKLAEVMQSSQKIANFKKRISQTNNVFDQKSMVMMIASYISAHRGALDYDHTLKMCDIFIHSKNPEISQLASQLLPKMSHKENFNRFEKLVQINKKKKQIEDLFYPLNTLITTALSSIILFAPLTVLIASLFYTVIPATCALFIGFAIQRYSIYLNNIRDHALSITSMACILSQSESPYFQKIFNKKLKKMIYNSDNNIRICDHDLQDTPKFLKELDEIAKNQPNMIKYCDIVRHKLGLPLRMSRHTQTLAQDDFLPRHVVKIATPAAPSTSDRHSDKKGVEEDIAQSHSLVSKKNHLK